MILTQAISRVVSFCHAHRKTPVFLRAAFAVLVALFLAKTAQATEVRIEVAYGDTSGIIDLELYDDLAPKTVMNFLRYAGRGHYTANGLFYFVAPGQGIRAGGFTYAEAPVEGSMIPIFFHIPEDPPISDEVFPPLLNTRGKIAMFKPCLILNSDGVTCDQRGDPTSEWTINLTNNTSSLNNVFGQVIAGMDVANAIGGLQTYVATNTHAAFISIPLVNFDNTGPILAENLVRVLRIPNVKSTLTDMGILATFTTDVDIVFDVVTTVPSNTALTWLTSFTSPPDQSVHFNNGMFALKMSCPIDANGRIVTLYDGATSRPTRYYAYGKTPDDPTDHWYDFSYNGETGAKIENDRIILHFVDGKRGDDDLTANNSITHTGAQAVVTENADSSSQAGGGCSIVATPLQTSRGGDWIAVSLFLTLLALIRRRTRNSRIQRA